LRHKLQLLLTSLFYLYDSFIVWLSLTLAWLVRKSILEEFASGDYQNYFLLLFILLPLFLLIYQLFDLYEIKRGQRYLNELIRIIEANLVAAVVIFGLFFAFQLFYVSRIFVIIFIIINTILAISARFIIRRFFYSYWAKGFNNQQVVVIGAGSLAEEFLSKMQSHQEFGYQIFGILDDDEKKQNKFVVNAKVIGKLDALNQILLEHEIDEVILALPLSAYERLDAIIRTCEKQGVKAMVIPDYFKYLPAKPRIFEFEGMPIFQIRDIPLDNFVNRFLKRTFDICGSLVLILLSLPIMILVAIGVKLSSPGPIFFRQERVGLNRKRFHMYKFRSMRVSTDEVACTTWTTASDPRKTNFGQFIRATSLDELPQFFNVLKGEMSLVGPRPERPNFVEKFREEIPQYMIKHQVKPGITGWAQINGWRGDTSIEERIKCDLHYIENWSLLLDVKIMFLTVFKGFINKNAY